MENTYEGCSQIEKEEIINGLESSLNGIFEQLSEKEGQKIVLNENTMRPPEESNEQIDKQQGLKKGQTNSKIVQRNLELHLSFEAQQKIQDILDDVRQLSEKEKLLLYLKLPTKTGSFTDESQSIPLSNTRQEQTQAFQWIRSNLEECESSYTLPKHEVYDDYKSYCESLGANRTLSAPDFGKIIKCVFPKVKARRLGTRGNSKYCYSGLRKRTAREAPSLPNVNGSSDGEVNNNSSNAMNDCNDLTEDQTLSAACNLVCEWANKLLGRVFTTLLDLARFLVGGSYVSTKSMAAFVVMSATESKVRKMSEKLQFRSSSNSSASPDLKQKSSARSQSPFESPVSTASERSTTKVQSLNASPSNNIQPNNFFHPNEYQLLTKNTSERPKSLPGLQVTTGNQESSKVSSILMSPPLCPPPKPSSHQIAREITPTGNPPVLTGINIQSRVVPVTTNAFMQRHDISAFPSFVQKSPQHPIRLSIQSQLPNQSPEAGSTKRQIQRSTLKRSESCPYPSQSPRQLNASQAINPLPRQPTDTVRRNSNWQTNVGNHQSIMLQSPEGQTNPVRNVNKLIQEQQKQQQQQILSPVRGTTILDSTIINRQAQMQRCHSVPVPFNSPQGDIYQPLTPQLRTQVTLSPVGLNGNAALNQLKQTRAKFLSSEIPSNARRNLTQSFLNDNDVTVSTKTKAFGACGQDRSNDEETAAVNDMKLGERKSVINNDTITETIGNPINAKGYGSGVAVRATNSIVLNARKQNSIIIEESSLNSVDSLIDSPFSMNSIDVSNGCDGVPSGGNGLNDLDGLDDAETIDLLRSLNSGNNIWVNEWNNTGVQLMESS